MTVTPDSPHDDNDPDKQIPDTGWDKLIPTPDERIFWEIIDGNWQQKPSLREHIDPVVKDIFALADKCARKLNRANDNPERKLDKHSERLLRKWDKSGLKGQTIRVTGKIRPILDDKEVLEYALGYDSYHALVGVLPEPQYDQRGIYYRVVDFPIRAGTVFIDQREVYLDETEVIGTYYEGCLGLLWGDDAEPEEPTFTITSSDLEYLGSSRDINSGVGLYLRECFPEIYSQIEQSIPRQCKNLDTIFRALDDFVLTVDRSRLAAIGLDWADFQDLVGEYLRERIGFDTTKYRLLVQGEVSTRTMDHGVVVHTHEKPEKYDVFINCVSIDYPPETTDDKPIVQCRACLEVFHDKAGWGEGKVPYFIPIDSVVGYQSMRSKKLPFASPNDQTVYHDDQTAEPYSVVPVDGKAFGSLLELLAQDELDTKENEFRSFLDETLASADDAIMEALTLDDHQKYLEKIEHNLSVILYLLRKLQSYPYPSKDACQSAMLHSQRLFSTFQSIYAKEGPELLVSGDGVQVIGASTTSGYHDDRPFIQIELDSDEYAPGHRTAEAYGFLSSYFSQTMTGNSDGTYSFATCLRLQDSDSIEVPPIRDKKTAFPVILPEITRYHQLDVSKDLEIVVPELTMRRQQDEAVERLASLFPGRPDVRQAMEAFKQELLLSDSNEYEPIESTLNLNELAQMAVDNPHVLPDVCEAVSMLIGKHGRNISMQGVKFTFNGEKIETVVEGTVVDIVPEFRYVAEREPYIVIQTTVPHGVSESSLIYVPLRTARAILI